MPDSSVNITEGSGLNIDTRTEGTNSNHRQVIVVGDPDTNSNVADVLNEDPGPTSTLQGLVIRLAGSARVHQAAAGTFAVYFDPATPSVSLSGITNSISVYLSGTAGTIAANVGKVDGTIAVFFSPAAPAVQNIANTIIIPQTVSGTVNTAGGSGSNTLKSPVASRNIKVYAYSLTTTAQVGITPRFTTGGSGGSTELWRLALQAPSAPGIAGANLAVTPPGYLFAAGTGNTLALYLDSASLVHYSVAYFLESA